MHIFTVFGYLDAGTGSVVIQSLIGVVAGVGVFGRKVIGGVGHKIKDLFSKTESSQTDKTTEKQ